MNLSAQSFYLKRKSLNDIFKSISKTFQLKRVTNIWIQYFNSNSSYKSYIIKAISSKLIRTLRNALLHLCMINFPVFININKNCILRNVRNRLQSRNEGIVIECRVNEQEKK